MNLKKMDRAADRLMKFVVIAFALYLVCECLGAWYTGAIERLVGK